MTRCEKSQNAYNNDKMELSSETVDWNFDWEQETESSTNIELNPYAIVKENC